MQRIICLVACLVAVSWAQSGTPLNVLPLPQKFTVGNDMLFLTPDFDFTPLGAVNTILDKAILRYKSLTFNHGQQSRSSDSAHLRSNQNNLKSVYILQGLDINVLSGSEDLSVETDESYNLTIAAPRASLNAATVYGALRGLETFSQLVLFNFTGETYWVARTPITVQDYPRFAHRGVLVDTARHFIPIAVLKSFIDSLPFAKVNVFHWHIVDTQSFPMESRAFPKLWEGAWSPEERYTVEDVQGIVQYAKERGVRVVAEFDGPGHAYAWGIGYPVWGCRVYKLELHPANLSLTKNCDNKCPPQYGNPCDVPLDPSKNFTYELLSGLFNEILGGASGQGYFTDDYIHLGGDEVEYGCWNASTEIAAWMKANNMSSFDDAYSYFVQRAHNYAVANGRIPIVWEEVFLHFGTSLPKNTVIQVWLNHDTLKSVVSAGLRGILSDNKNWYLDHTSTTWETFYQNEPFTNITDPVQQSLILGGEACSWGETQTPGNLFVRVWPRMAAVAERLWSAQTVVNLDDAFVRIEQFKCRLFERGVDSGPTQSYGQTTGPGSCLFQ